MDFRWVPHPSARTKKPRIVIEKERINGDSGKQEEIDLIRLAPSGNRAGLGHSSILLLETKSHSLRCLDELVEAAIGTADLSWGQRFSCEIEDAVLEATLDHV